MSPLKGYGHKRWTVVGKISMFNRMFVFENFNEN